MTNQTITAQPKTTSQPSTQLTSQPQLNNAPVIEIGLYTSIIGIVIFLVSLGIAWGTLTTKVNGIIKSLDKKVEPDLKDIRERFSVVEVKVDSLWKNEYAPANSPRQLNTKGNKILEESGIKEIVEKDREKLMELVKKRDIKNAYDAEERIFKIMMNLPKHCPEVVDELKTGAFNAGVDLDAVLFIGGIHLRNLIFEELGFKLLDLDKKKEISKD
jgi:hypothetical protein